MNDVIENKIHQLKELSKKQKKLSEIKKDIADILGNANMDEKKEIAKEMSKIPYENIHQARNLQFIVPHIVKELYDHEGQKGEFVIPKKTPIITTPIIEDTPIIEETSEEKKEEKKKEEKKEKKEEKKEKKEEKKEEKNKKGVKIEPTPKKEEMSLEDIMKMMNELEDDLNKVRAENKKNEAEFEKIKKEKEEIEKQLNTTK